MKKIIIIALVLIGLICNSQKVNTNDSSSTLYGTLNRIPNDSHYVWFQSVFNIDTLSHGFSGATKFKSGLTDTIRVLMLVCDTAFEKNIDKQIIVRWFPPDSSKYEYSASHRIMDVWWMFGYEVRKVHSGTEGMIDPGFYLGVKFEDWYSHIEYLDEKKKPLPKSSIVWISKEINK